MPEENLQPRKRSELFAELAAKIDQGDPAAREALEMGVEFSQLRKNLNLTRQQLEETQDIDGEMLSRYEKGLLPPAEMKAFKQLLIEKGYDINPQSPDQPERTVDFDSIIDHMI